MNEDERNTRTPRSSVPSSAMLGSASRQGWDAEPAGDEAFVRELLGALSDDLPEVPAALPEETMRKVHAEITSRDLLDLTTLVFLLRFCAPLLDLFAAFFGRGSASGTRVTGIERDGTMPMSGPRVRTPRSRAEQRPGGRHGSEGSDFDE